MNTAKIFMNGRSQAVRLPKEFQFSSKEVYISRVGDAVLLVPMDKAWDIFVQSLDEFTPDFMADREQPAWDADREAI